MFFFKFMSEGQTREEVVGLMSQVPLEFWKRATMPLIPLLPTWREYEGLLVLVFFEFIFPFVGAIKKMKGPLA